MPHVDVIVALYFVSEEDEKIFSGNASYYVPSSNGRRESTGDFVHQMDEESEPSLGDSPPPLGYWDWLDGPRLEFCWHADRKSRSGFLLGSSESMCDVTILKPDISAIHGQLSFDDKNRLIYRDLRDPGKYGDGSAVIYDGNGKKRRNFTWLLSGSDYLNTHSPEMILQIHEKLKFRVYVPPRDWTSAEHAAQVTTFHSHVRPNNSNLLESDLPLSQLTMRSVSSMADVLVPDSTETLACGIFIKIRVLGTGSFGEFNHLYDVSQGTYIVRKSPAMGKLEGWRKELWKAEINCLNRIKQASSSSPEFSRHVIQILNGTVDPPIIDLEYMSYGNLQSQHRTRRLSGYETQVVLEQTLKALSFIHGFGMIHRNVKASNILVEYRAVVGPVSSTQHGGPEIIHIRLADFSLSAKADDLDTELVGTPRYMAPELFKSPPLPYTTAVDIWATGVMVFELAYGFPDTSSPFGEEMCRHVLNTVQNTQSRLAKFLATYMARWNEFERLSARNCLDRTLEELPAVALNADEIMDLDAHSAPDVDMLRPDSPDNLSWGATPRSTLDGGAITLKSGVLYNDTDVKSETSDVSVPSTLFTTSGSSVTSASTLDDNSRRLVAEELADLLYRDSDLRTLYPQAVRKFGLDWFSTNHDKLLRVFMKDLRRAAPNEMLKRSVRYLGKEHLRTRITTRISRLITQELGGSTLWDQEEDRSYTLNLLLSQGLEMSETAEHSNPQEKYSHANENGPAQPPEELEDSEEKSDGDDQDEVDQQDNLELLSIVVEFITTGSPFESFKSNFSSFTNPPTTIPAALSLRDLRALNRFLRKRFDDVAQGEYSWLRELENLGYSQREISQLLFEAERTSRRSLGVSEGDFGEEHAHALQCMNSVALVLRDQARYQHAEYICRRALQRREEVLGNTHLDTIASLDCLASILQRQKLFKESLELYEKACSSMGKSSGFLRFVEEEVRIGLGYVGYVSDPDNRYTVRMTVFWELQQCIRDELDHDPSLSPVFTVSGNALHAWAAGCRQYVESTWGHLGEIFLDYLEQGLRDIKTGSTGNRCDFVFGSLEDETQGLPALVVFEGTFLEVSILGQFLSWITATFRLPRQGKLSLSEVEFRCGLSDNDGPKAFSLRLWDLSLLREDGAPGTCWHSLFPTTVMAGGFPVPSHTGVTGVQVPFDVMLKFAGILYHVDLQEAEEGEYGIYFRSLSSILYPTDYFAESNIVQWHLVTNIDQMGLEWDCSPEDIADSRWVKIRDFETLTSATAILGYCREAAIQLGTEARRQQYNSFRFSLSSLEKPPPEATLGTVSAGISAMGFGTAQVGGAFKYRNGLVNTSSSTDEISYWEVLNRAEKESVILFETEPGNERGWLVPKLSVILDLLNYWAEKNSATDIRYAQPSSDGGSAAKSVLQVPEYANQVLVEPIMANESALLVGDMVKRIYSQMSRRETKSAASKRGAKGTMELGHRGLLGWDLRELVDQWTVSRRRSVNPHVTHIDPDINVTPCWLPLTRTIPVYFAQGLGEVIAPVRPRGVCQKWQPIPGGLLNNYLVASVRCINSISSSYGHDDCCVIFDDLVWDYNDDTVFDDCGSCIADRREACRKMLQVLRVTKQRCTQRERRRNGSYYPEIPMNGAVVFGNKQGMRLAILQAIERSRRVGY